ncbi:hypothetical protein CR513_48511, partial [Mucuna pruriens]
MVSQQLYRRGFSYPLLKCLDVKEAKTHIGERALANKIARARYYWLTLKKDCTDFIKDVTSPFLPVVGQVKFFIVAIDYFTKWVETKPKLKFHFNLPSTIVSNNETQYVTQLVAEIKQSFTSIEHPQTNKQVKSSNKVVLKGLMKQLEEAKG